MIIKRDAFCDFIELLHKKTGQTYIDSVLDACEQFSVNEDMVKDLLNIQIISKLEAEAKGLNFIKNTSHSIREFI
jgi:hypothetical protein